MKAYGKEVLIDLHNCDASTFTRKSIRNYFKEICELIDMQREKLTWWDDLHTPEAEKETEPHLVGTSAVQFIKTSNITIHTLDIMKRAYVNIFSCKGFSPEVAATFTEKWFRGSMVGYRVVERK